MQKIAQLSLGFYVGTLIYGKVQFEISSKQLKSIVKPFMDLNRNGCVLPVLIILLSLVLRIQNINLFVDFVDTMHSPMCIVEHRYEDL
jgi:hypothetical protein